MSEKRFVQSFERGLDVLAALNVINGATIGDVARRTGLNRAIVFRLLETLRRKGYVRKTPSDPKYWLEAPVRNLADGYSDEAWVDDLRPQLDALGHETLWPVSISTLANDAMLVRATSDYESPLVMNRFPRGFRFSVVGSAAGQAYLASCSSELRQTVIAAVARARRKGDDRLIAQPGALTRLLADVRRKGYASSVRQNDAVNAVAVPILAKGLVVGALSLRYFASAMSAREAVAQYLPRLQACAAVMGKRA